MAEELERPSTIQYAERNTSNSSVMDQIIPEEGVSLRVPDLDTTDNAEDVVDYDLLHNNGVHNVIHLSERRATDNKNNNSNKDRSGSILSRARTSLRRTSASVKHRFSMAVMKSCDTVDVYLDPEHTIDSRFTKDSSRLFIFFQVSFFLVWTVFSRYPTVLLTCPTTFMAIAAMSGMVRMTDATTRGERVLVGAGLLIVLVTSSMFIAAVANPCSHCAYHWASDKYIMTSTASANNNNNINNEAASSGKNRFDGWRLFLTTEGDSHTFMGSCRACVGDVVKYTKVPQAYIFPDKEVDREAMVLQEEQLFDIQPYQTTNSVYGDLADWYIWWTNQTAPADMNRFNRKLFASLANGGSLNDQELTETLTEYLCSPASRFDQPDPARFLADLKKPRFTGETELNISATALQSIMRGDPLKEMGVTVCFMLRFALFVPEDYQLEYKPIQYTNMLPPMNEKNMRSQDYSTALPFLVTPGRDQDIDPDSTDMNQFKAIMDIFTRFPYEPKRFYFSTKEEYYAFYRWELEGTIQDEWYFPRWLLDTKKGTEMADFMAKKFKVSNDHLALKNPYTDMTLGDRCFYGAGQQFLTPIKLPGLDPDYDYKFPATRNSYLSEEHHETDAFRFPHKPTSDDLLKMIYNFWPKEAKRKPQKDSVPLARFKNKIVEIDFAIIAALEARTTWHTPGCILYLDAKSKLPIGIWKSTTKTMILPQDGSDWEHAKFYYRVTERAVLATLHVIENHFGYSQAVSTAAWQTLDKSHPIRVLLKPFTLNVHSVNWAAYHMLVRKDSVLTHGSSFSTRGVVNSMMTFWRHFNFSQTSTEKLDATKMEQVMDTDTLPFYSQTRRLFATHRRFVQKMVDLAYPTDQDLVADDSIVRFWHHSNTYGRHLDNCVCDLPANLFFDDDHWPGFETSRTCMELLDMLDFEAGKHDVTRRRHWCVKTDPYEKAKAMTTLNEQLCSANPDCERIWWDQNSMRPDMGLKKLLSKSQFVDFLATFIFVVTGGHAVNGDNISFFSDADYSGVRMVDFGPDGELPQRIDVGTYVFGTSVGSLTTVRCPPLLADWRPIYSHMVANEKDVSTDNKHRKLQIIEDIHNKYKFELFDLSVAFLDESSSRPLNRRSNALNPATHASSVSV